MMPWFRWGFAPISPPSPPPSPFARSRSCSLSRPPRVPVGHARRYTNDLMLLKLTPQRVRQLRHYFGGHLPRIPQFRNSVPRFKRRVIWLPSCPRLRMLHWAPTCDPTLCPICALAGWAWTLWSAHSVHDLSVHDSSWSAHSPMHDSSAHGPSMHGPPHFRPPCWTWAS